MKTIKAIPIVVLMMCLSGAFAQQAKKDNEAKKSPAMDQHGDMKMVKMDNMTWSPGPKSLPEGAQMMVLSGDPSKEGLFTIRLKFPAGYKVMPHWHNADEHVTLLKGKMKLGMGDTFDEASMKESNIGTYILMPVKMKHYAMAVEESIFQLHGMGPFKIFYVDPKNDPTKMSSR